MVKNLNELQLEAENEVIIIDLTTQNSYNSDTNKMP